MNAPANEITGLSYTQVAAIVSLFYEGMLTSAQQLARVQADLSEEMRRQKVPSGRAVIWSNNFPTQRKITFIPAVTQSLAVTFAIPGKGQGLWCIQPERGVNRITITDAPEKGKADATSITFAYHGDRGWTLSMTAGPGANPKYKAKVDELKRARQAA